MKAFPTLRTRREGWGTHKDKKQIPHTAKGTPVRNDSAKKKSKVKNRRPSKCEGLRYKGKAKADSSSDANRILLRITKSGPIEEIGPYKSKTKTGSSPPFANRRRPGSE